MKKTTLAGTVAVLAVALLAVSIAHRLRPARAARLACTPTCCGTVDKQPGDSFTVRIAFKNTGTAEGAWNTAVTFEGDAWTWKGAKTALTLEPDQGATLTWEGTVPFDAAEGSMARLVVYYAGEHVALNWWIHVVPGAELAIMDSAVT
jgi:hypothetical protein